MRGVDSIVGGNKGASGAILMLSSQFARRKKKLRPRVRAAWVPDVGAGRVLGGPPRDRGQPDGGQAQEGQRGRAAAGAGLGIMMMIMNVFN